VASVTRRSAEVRLDALLRTAIDVIVERGLANTRTADVAAAAGVSQALVFYHFASKDQLLAQAFAYAAEQDLARLDAVLAGPGTPREKFRKLVKIYAPVARSKSWAIWIDGWSQALRQPEFEKLSRKLDLRWKEVLTELITAGVADGSFTCPDPTGAAWRILCLIDGIAVQMTVHPKVVSKTAVGEWIDLAAAREVGVDTL
jgi:AcrR family transcriptional regulator